MFAFLNACTGRWLKVHCPFVCVRNVPQNNASSPSNILPRLRGDNAIYVDRLESRKFFYATDFDREVESLNFILETIHLHHIWRRAITVTIRMPIKICFSWQIADDSKQLVSRRLHNPIDEHYHSQNIVNKNSRDKRLNANVFHIFTYF